MPFAAQARIFTGVQPTQDLFADTTSLPDGLVYQPEFIRPDEEGALLSHIRTLPVAEARYKEYVAKRRTASFGYGYDFVDNALQPAPPIPDFLLPLRGKVASWANVSEAAFVQGLVTEYRPGTPIGWHRDVPQFGIVVGVSLEGACTMRFRPYPPSRRERAFTLALGPRSAYLFRDAIRWRWQHSIPEVPALRYSITFRTLA